jgi:hypothetical protein
MDPLKPHIEQRLEAAIAEASRENIIIPAQGQVAMSSQAEILRLDIRGILTDQVEIVDDRERLAP